jgi:6-phosphofructokinase 1
MTAPMRVLGPDDLAVKRLGASRFDSPLGLSSVRDDLRPDYVADDACQRFVLDVGAMETDALRIEKAGPRARIYFDPAHTRAAIVTCGGLCPGINNVIRAIVLELVHRYHVTDVVGFRYGYEGLDEIAGVPKVALGVREVSEIHKHGGSVLGVGRGAQSITAMVDRLEREGIDMLFTVGGDGTLKGAHAIAEEIARRGLSIAIVGVPKTIDNDVAYIDQTFGFDSAVALARVALEAAHTEAVSARNGIGLVKLMGRESGFIAARATLASADVNFCLVPEVPFSLEGEEGFLRALERRLEERGHALVVVAEGCAVHLARPDELVRDASGNVRFAGPEADVGARLRDAIVAYFGAKKVPITLKLIDPSYMVRSVPANASDAVLCDELARHAVHAAMAGRTDVLVARRHGTYVHVPIALAVSERKRIDPDGSVWQAVMATTGQPSFGRA